MRVPVHLSAVVLMLLAVLCGCGSGARALNPVNPAQTQVSPPVVTTKAAQNGAQVVSLSSSTAGSTIHYTVDGTSPTSSSPIFQAPFLVATNLTVNTYATLSGDKDSAVTTKV